MKHLDVCLFVLTLLSAFFLPSSQGFRTCDASSPCTPLKSCPPMVKLVQSGSRENLNRVRDAICGFKGIESLVCCESGGGSVISSSPSPVGKLVDLLPSDCGRPSTADKIVGGEPAPIGAYPWTVAMGYTEPGVRGVSFLCAGSLINEKYVLTAAHCVAPKELGRRKLAVLHLGDWNLKTSEDCQQTILGKTCAGAATIVAGSEEIVTHPDYGSRAKASDDIALIRLNVTVDFQNTKGNIAPVCLPKSGIDVRGFVGDRNLVAVGWGFTEHGNNSDVLLRVEVPLVEDSLCQERYQTDFVGKQLCVGGKGGFDTCSGDSGGPLVISKTFGPPFTQIGIVSFGPMPCGLNKFPGVYTSVADFRNWILANLKP